MMWRDSATRAMGRRGRGDGATTTALADVVDAVRARERGAGGAKARRMNGFGVTVERRLTTTRRRDDAGAGGEELREG